MNVNRFLRVSRDFAQVRVKRGRELFLLWVGVDRFRSVLRDFGPVRLALAASLFGFGSAWTVFAGFGMILGAGASQACSLNVLNH